MIFDLLDTADILDILFDEGEREMISQSLESFVLCVTTLNLLLPAVPLLTLSKTEYGHRRLRRRMVYFHRVMMILLVNVPNLLVRMILWHGFSVGISPFTLKNILLIALTLYEFYEHKLEKYESHQREVINNGRGDGHCDGRDGVSIIVVPTDGSTCPSCGRETMPSGQYHCGCTYLNRFSIGGRDAVSKDSMNASCEHNEAYSVIQSDGPTRRSNNVINKSSMPNSIDAEITFL